MWTDDLDPVTFCDECAPEDGDFIPLPTLPGGRQPLRQRPLVEGLAPAG